MKSHALGPQAVFLSVILVVFLVFGVVGILHHEMWRDECQPWLIARDSSSLQELSFNRNQETHPPLWFFLLYLITRFTSSPVFMQWAHLAIAVLCAWVFLWFSPFSKWQKALFVFGYFPVYEYAVKSRGYSLGILFLFVFCSFLTRSRRRYVLLFSMLFLASQANFMSALISVCLGTYLLLELFGKPEASRDDVPKRDLGLGVTLFVLMLIVLKFETVLYPELFSEAFMNGPEGWHVWFDWGILKEIVGRICETYLFPSEGLRLISVDMRFFVSLGLLFYMGLAFLRRPKILLVYALGTLLYLGLFYVAPFTDSWHFGHLFILLIICCWISKECAPIQLKTGFLDRASFFSERHLNKVLFILLLANFVAGMISSFIDWKRPYSAGRDAARFIEESGLERLPIIGDMDYAVMPVCAYLNKKIFYPVEGKFCSFLSGSVKSEAGRHPKPTLVLREAERLMRKNKSSVLMVLNYKLDEAGAGLKYRKIKEFTGSLIGDENLYLYLMPYKSTGALLGSDRKDDALALSKKM